MKFTKKAFAKWLNSKSDRESVGKPEYIDKCPLYNFLKSQGAKTVSMTIYSRNVNGILYSNPEWAITFQKACCAYIGSNDNMYITARTAARHLG